MTADLRHGLLFVAGGFTGQAYVYDLRTGATVAVYQFAEPDTGMVAWLRGKLAPESGGPDDLRKARHADCSNCLPARAAPVHARRRNAR
jgi:hypothetical protein